jgi:hypothetical protein
VRLFDEVEDAEFLALRMIEILAVEGAMPSAVAERDHPSGFSA